MNSQNDQSPRTQMRPPYGRPQYRHHSNFRKSVIVPAVFIILMFALLGYFYYVQWIAK